MALHSPPASGFGLLDTAPAAPDLSPALQAWRDWLRGRSVSAGTEPAPPPFPVDDLAEGLARRKDLIDWLFPADEASQPLISEAPTLRATDVRALIAPLDPLPPDPAAPWRRARAPERTLDARLLAVYVRWLALLGLSLDHHGALQPRDTPPHPDWDARAWRPWQRQAVLRVVRFLHLAGWQGHSTTAPLSLLDSHADHLARWAADAVGPAEPGFTLALRRALAEDPALVSALERAVMHPSPAHRQQALAACLQRRRFVPGLNVGGMHPPAGPLLLAAGRAPAQPGYLIDAASPDGTRRPVTHWRWIVTATLDGEPALQVMALDAQDRAARSDDGIVGPGGQRVRAIGLPESSDHARCGSAIA